MKSPRARLLVALTTGMVLVTTLVVYATLLRTSSELPQRDALRKLGVLVSMDGTKRYVSAVNFATLNDKTLVPAALQVVAQLDHLGTLDLSRTPITDADADAFRNLRSLTSLSLVDTEVGDEALQSLRGMNRLVGLYLGGTNVTDAGIPHIASLEALKILDLTKTSVSGRLAPLSTMPNLEWIILGKLSLEEGALLQLEGAPKLKHLTLSGAKIAVEDVEAFKRSRPEVVVDL